MAVWDAEELRQVMTSSTHGQERGNVSDYARLATAIDRKWVKVRQIKIPEYETPDRRDVWRRFVYETAMRDTGNEEHGELKWRAWNWLLEKYKSLGHFECKFKDLRFDVFSDRRSIAVECGDTDPAKFFKSVALFSIDGASLESHGLKRFLVLPRYSDAAAEFTVTAAGQDPMSRHLRWRRELAIERNNVNRQAKDPDAFMYTIGFRRGHYVPEDLGVPATEVHNGNSSKYYP